MKNAKEKLDKVMAILKNVKLKEEEQVVEMATVTLENGTVFEAENFESGTPVFIIQDEERIPVPVGDYELDDGKILVVSEEGVIGEIKDAEVVDDEVVEEEMEKEEKVEMTEDEKLREMIKGVVTEVLTEMSEQEEVKEEEVKEEKTEMSEQKVIKPNPEGKKPNGLNLIKRDPNRRMSATDKVMQRLYGEN